MKWQVRSQQNPFELATTSWYQAITRWLDVMQKKILIIDDESDMRLYLRTLFTKAGYETEVANNGDDGLKKALEFEPDLITLDILMPRKSGIKAYEGLRKNPKTRNVPIIILTGLSRREDFFPQRDDLPMPDAMLEKPIDRESFLEKARELIGQ